MAGEVLGILDGGSYRIGKAERLGINNRIHQVSSGVWSASRGMLSGQQDIEQDAQRVDISGGRDGSPAQLFGSGTCRCHGSHAIGCELRLENLTFAFQKLSDSEVQQLYVAVVSHQNVRGLEIAMNDQIGVGMGHRAEHAQKQTDTLRNAELLVITVLVEMHALNVLENQVRLP